MKNSQKYRLWIVTLIYLFATMLNGCTTTGPQSSHPVTAIPTPLQIDSPSISQTPVESTTDTTQTAIASQRPPDTEIGWLLTTPNRETAFALIDKGMEYNLTHIQLGGTFLQSIDDIILKPSVGELVRDVADRADQRDMNTYIWSRELNLDGRTFHFNRESPLVAARQSAYRTALTKIPEIDGVVLTFEGALLPPWNAVVPEGQPSPPGPERIHFVIDVIRSVVVDELDKRLLIRVDTGNPDQKKWIAQTLESYPAEVLTILTPSDLSPLRNHRQLIEYDLNESPRDGKHQPPLTPERLFSSWLEKRSENVHGIVCRIEDDNTSIFNTGREINLFALSLLAERPHASLELIRHEWVQRRYGMLPASTQTQLMSRLLRAMEEMKQKMPTAKGFPVLDAEDLIPTDGRSIQIPEYDMTGVPVPGIEFLMREFQSPNEQTLIDLAQESYEVHEILQQAQKDLESLRESLKPSDYEDLHRQLGRQTQLAEVLYYVKQCLWGYQLWGRSLDEEEALYLEAHLQRLEQLAGELDGFYTPQESFIDPSRIRTFVADLRNAFPRVLLGSRPRTWNRLKNISIEQISASGVEIKWESEFPSLSRIFAGTQAPLFDIVKEGPASYTTRHRIILDGLQPGKTFSFKIQCITDRHNVTNSGNLTLYLQPPAIL